MRRISTGHRQATRPRQPGQHRMVDHRAALGQERQLKDHPGLADQRERPRMDLAQRLGPALSHRK